MSQIYEHNRLAWDGRARQRQRHTLTATAAQLKNPLPILDREGWLDGSLAGRRVLCLASGGGLQSALCAAAGAVVTVVDLSPEMLALDKRVAAQHGLRVRTVAASMDDLSAVGDASFELVLQPVSSCYVADVGRVYREVARVLAPGGLYVSQHKQPVSLQADAAPSARGYVLSEPYYRQGPLPEIVEGHRHREADNLEFLHRWEDLIGGLCRSGFVVEDLSEPRHARVESGPGSFEHRSCFAPPYVKIKARRIGAAQDAAKRLWVP